MVIRRSPDIPSSEITPERVYLNRRSFLKTAAAGALAAAAPGAILAGCRPGEGAPSGAEDPRLDGISIAQGTELRPELTPYSDVTTYNNFYEFGRDKGDPVRYAGDFQPRPWTVEVGGHCERPGTWDLEDFFRRFELEDRIYRFRCVEAWSMVIPWRGLPLADFVRHVQPTSQARYVAFTTVFRPEEMRGQRQPILDWPYREGLRMDEALHPLALLSTGVYGEDLPNQNGAPLRLVVPWKYGFKSIKSIVKIDFVEEMPFTTWAMDKPHEYGFYANVNPEVDHPRWTQARERRIGELQRRPTLPFNGYGEQVASLYSGMDLTEWY